MGGLSNSRGNSQKSAPVKNSHGNSQESASAMNADIQPGQQICWRFEPKDAVLVDRPKGGTI